MASHYLPQVVRPEVPLSEMSPSTRGRILAGLYLFVVVSGVVAQAFIADNMIVANAGIS